MRILRLNNDICELAEIGDELEDLQAEVKGYIEIVSLGATLRMVVNEEGLFSNFRFNRPVLGEFNEGNQSENEAFPFPKSYFNDYCITCQHIGNHFWTFDQSRVFH